MRQLNKLFLLLTFISLPLFGFSIITFEESYGTIGTESAWGVEFTDDGGYITAGYTSPSGVVDTNVYVIRWTANGGFVWAKSIGSSSGHEFGYTIIKATDGNFVIAGSSTTLSAGKEDFYLLKIDPAGTVIWQKTYGTAGTDVGRSVCQTKDGGFCIAGYSYTTLTNLDGYLVKTDADGNFKWSQVIGGTGDDHFYSIQQLPDEGYILTGGTTSIGHGNMDVYLVKTDVSGNVKWQEGLGGVNFDEGKCVRLTPDGNYIIAGQTDVYAGDNDAYVVKTDTAGNKIWSQSYGQTEKDLARSIENTSGGGFIIGAITRSFGLGNPNMWLIKTDALGVVTWQKNFGGDQHEHCYSAKPTPDGGYILAGHTDSYSGSLDVYLVKVNGSGNVTGINEKYVASDFITFPNPASSFVKINFYSESPGNYSFRLTNIMGIEVYQASEILASGDVSKTISFESMNMPVGMYFLEIKKDGFVKNERLIVGR